MISRVALSIDDLPEPTRWSKRERNETGSAGNLCEAREKFATARNLDGAANIT
jgi:hypothetical protein